MKLFKRFASAMLVGVMSLAMLTACGGGAGGSVAIGTQFEKSVAKAAGMENDAALRTEAMGMLDKINPDDATILKTDAELTEGTHEGWVITVEDMAELATQEDTPDTEPEKVTALAISTDTISKVVKVLQNKEESFSKIGIATKVIKGKTYAAIVIDTAAASTDDGEKKDDQTPSETPDDNKDNTGDTDKDQNTSGGSDSDTNTPAGGDTGDAGAGTGSGTEQQPTGDGNEE